jgi:hypothetical protein
MPKVQSAETIPEGVPVGLRYFMNDSELKDQILQKLNNLSKVKTDDSRVGPKVNNSPNDAVKDMILRRKMVEVEMDNSDSDSFSDF